MDEGHFDLLYSVKLIVVTRTSVNGKQFIILLKFWGSSNLPQVTLANATVENGMGTVT